MKEMRFEIEIEAPKEAVWRTLWQDETLRQWAGIIDPGTHMVGELKQGNQVEYISGNGYGVTSLVEQLIEGELLVLKHKSDTQDSGTRMRDDEWTGGAETYKLAEKEGVTTLITIFDVPAELEDYFKTAYPKALDKVKTLTEAVA